MIYRDGFEIIYDILKGIQDNEQLPRYRILGLAGLSGKTKDYLDKLISKEYLTSVENNGHGRSSLAKTYELTNKGKEFLLYLKEWNN